jgi:hypothetical protein
VRFTEYGRQRWESSWKQTARPIVNDAIPVPALD